MRALNILVAEDDDQNQAMMRLILARQGHHIVSAWNGPAALEAVKSGNFDLVFMDVQMPEMDGLETTRQIRLWENHQRHIPIVILTGSVPEKITEEYKNAGADTFLLKPFDFKRIIMLVEIFARESEAGLTVEIHQSPEISYSQVPLLDLQDSLSRFNNDTDFFLENFEEFIQSLPDRSEKLEHSLKMRSWHDLTTHAHNLKGVAANFGARQLSILASRLNEYSDQHELNQASITYNEILQNIAKLTELANNIIKEHRSHTSDPRGGQ